MDSARWNRVKAIFGQAESLRGEERDSFVRAECGDDAELLQEVISLLKSARTSDDTPPTSFAAALHAEARGSVIGRYTLIEELGSGGFGVVWLAEQRHPVARQVAIKIIKLGMDTRQVIARFEAERQALAIMDHPNVAKVFDAGATETGRPYFVMELIRGVPITNYCDENRLNVRQRIELMVPVCQAVQHAHQKGIIHRDIKPSNVLVVTTADGPATVKVIDFGIAKAIDQRLTEKTVFTQENQMIGTPAYMSPEQAGGELDIDTRTDVYSLGVLLYELLAGVTPFSAEDLRSAAYQRIQQMIRESEPPKPSTRISELDSLPTIAAQRKSEPRRLAQAIQGELDWIVMKCLDKDRARRYETANGLAADLSRYLNDEPVQASPPSRAYRLKKLVRRNKTAVATTAAFAVVLTTATLISAWQATVARRERDRADAQAAEATRQKTEAEMQRAEAERQRGEAEQKQNEAMAIVDFMNQFILDGATPARMPDKRNRDAVVEAMLNPAAQQVRKQLAHVPRLQAAVMMQVCSAFMKLGRFAEAEPLAQESLDIRARLLGEDHPETLASMNAYGYTLRELGKLDLSAPLSKRVLEHRRRTLGAEHADTIQAMANYAGNLATLGNNTEAEPVFAEIVRLRRKLNGEHHQDTDMAINNHAWVLWRLERIDEAEVQMRDFLERSRMRYGEHHPISYQAISNYGALLRALDRNVEAADYNALALNGRLKLLGPNHPATLESMTNTALTYLMLGRGSEAEAMQRDATEKAIAMGIDRPHAIGCARSYVSVLLGLDRADDAQTVARVLKLPDPTTKPYWKKAPAPSTQPIDPEQDAAIRAFVAKLAQKSPTTMPATQPTSRPE